MAGLFCDPFDQYANVASMLAGVWANVGGAWSLSTANPSSGAQSLKFVSSTDDVGGINGTNTIRHIFGAAKTAGAGFGFRLWPQFLPNTEANAAGSNFGFRIAWLTAAGAVQASVVIGTDGALVPYIGGDFGTTNGGVVSAGARSVPCVFAQSYNFIEAFCYANDGAGTLEVRVDGVTRLNLSGLHNDPASAGEVSQVIIGCPTQGVGNNIMGNVYLDELDAWDTLAGAGPTSFVGNRSALYRAPVADTAMADWGKTGGATGYPLLCDNNDATYISAGSTGEKSAFSFAALPSDVSAVIYQQINWRGLKTSGGDCAITPFFVSSGVEDDLTPQAMTTAEAWRWAIEANDPNTGSPYTPAAANASTAGFDRTT